MQVFELTRRLIDIESITPNETEIGNFLWELLSRMARQFNGKAERMPVERDRDNIFVHFDEPVATLSTHIDTVPPFIPSREDSEHIWGRGACDTKGIIAAMIAAAEQLLEAGNRLRIPRLFAALTLLSAAGILIYWTLDLLSHWALRRWHESEIAEEED